MKFIDVRIFFSKTGNLKYISHLDLYRTMGRVIKRSKLPVWITEGFNPHIYMTFALPLALGIEGVNESVDLRLLENIEFSRVAEQLNAVMPSGLNVIRAAAPVRKADDIERAEYELCSERLDLIGEYFSQEEIKITKRTKKSVREIDVKPLLEWNGATLSLPAGNTLNISPWNVLSGLDVDVKIKRTEILCSDGGNFI